MRQRGDGLQLWRRRLVGGRLAHAYPGAREPLCRGEPRVDDLRRGSARPAPHQRMGPGRGTGHAVVDVEQRDQHVDALLRDGLRHPAGRFGAGRADRHRVQRRLAVRAARRRQLGLGRVPVRDRERRDQRLEPDRRLRPRPSRWPTAPAWAPSTRDSPSRGTRSTPPTSTTRASTSSTATSIW